MEKNLNDFLNSIGNNAVNLPYKPFEVTVDLRAEKVRRNSQNILVSMERYEELIKAEQDAEYLKEWVNKTAKSEKSGYEVKAEAVVLNTIFNESEE